MMTCDKISVNTVSLQHIATLQQNINFERICGIPCDQRRLSPTPDIIPQYSILSTIAA